ncbi:unnamed protein product [Polarella glacialis]|uniref:CSD domain-containing protein n=1 Tax=Polarella glacialis TaxID=89957 RepID=A0A813EIC8_POLGL|nr:unnamed protein product [Polarella glacialis]
MLGQSPASVFWHDGATYVVESAGNRVVRLRGSGREVVAGGNGKGSHANQLDRPWRIFVSKLGLYVVDRNNARVQRWLHGADAGETVAGGQGQGHGLHQLDQPVGVFVSPVGDVYVVDRANHRVVCWPPGAAEGRLVAGGRGFGSRSEQLACPAAVVLDGDALYVSDEGNDRVQCWVLGAQSGVTVAGGRGPGGRPDQFYHPLGICVAAGHLFVADSLNYRVQRWPLDGDGAARAAGAVTVAGGLGLGSGAGQLGQPMSVHVDELGRLLVADMDNGRVQAYPLEEQERVARETSAASGVADLAAHAPVDQERICGHCVEYRANSGFGFVLDDTGRRLFAHHSDIAASEVRFGYPKLLKGEQVEFQARRDEKWGWRCSAITAPGGGPTGGATSASESPQADSKEHHPHSRRCCCCCFFCFCCCCWFVDVGVVHQERRRTHDSKDG